MYVKHLTSLQFLTYVAFGIVVLSAIMRAIPGRAPPVRREPYPERELTAGEGVGERADLDEDDVTM